MRKSTFLIFVSCLAILRGSTWHCAQGIICDAGNRTRSATCKAGTIPTEISFWSQVCISLILGHLATDPCQCVSKGSWRKVLFCLNCSGCEHLPCSVIQEPNNERCLNLIFPSTRRLGNREITGWYKGNLRISSSWTADVSVLRTCKYVLPPANLPLWARRRLMSGVAWEGLRVLCHFDLSGYVFPGTHFHQGIRKEEYS